MQKVIIENEWEEEYHAGMYLLAVMVAGLLGLAQATPLPASDAQPSRTPGFNERLNEALDAEGGVQVYKDAAGTVGTVLDPPGGERRFTVQPPQSPSINLGPLLQLHTPPSFIPQPVEPLMPDPSPHTR
jgi:hypothetical protein